MLSSSTDGFVIRGLVELAPLLATDSDDPTTIFFKFSKDCIESHEDWFPNYIMIYLVDEDRCLICIRRSLEFHCTHHQGL